MEINSFTITKRDGSADRFRLTNNECHHKGIRVCG